MPFLPQAFVLGSFYACFATGRVCIGWRKGAWRGGGVGGRADVTRPLPLRKFAACDIITLEGTA